MLSPASILLARRDPAIAGLALLLDDDALADMIDRMLPGAGIGAVTKRYIRYKPGTNCLVRLDIQSAKGVLHAYAKAHGPDADIKLNKAQQRSAASTFYGPGRHVIAGHNTVVCLFPNDDKLKMLRRLGDPVQRQRLLNGIFLDRRDCKRAVLHTLQYKPERRLVARVDKQDVPSAALKLYARKGFDRAARVRCFLQDAGVDLFPAIIGWSDRFHATATTWINGSRLDEAMSGDDFDDDWVGMLGEHMRTMHAIAPEGGLAIRSPLAEAERLLQLALTAGFLVPELASDVQDLAGRISGLLTTVPPGRRLVHGDFYAKQVLCTDTGIQLVDSDDLSLGNPAGDIGLFLAHLDRDVLRGRLEAARAAAIETRLFESYGGDRNEREAQLFAAAGLLQLLHHPFRNCDADYPARMHEILDACRARLKRYLPAEAIGLHAERPVPKTEAKSDEEQAGNDGAMPFIPAALDSESVGYIFRNQAWCVSQGYQAIDIRLARLRRYRRGRRCIIEYTCSHESARGQDREFGLMGKVRARGLDIRTWLLNKALHDQGFTDDSADGVAVPEPVACLPTFNMWLQRKVPGVPVWMALNGDDGAGVAERVAEAIHKLHAAGVPATRTHSIRDELEVLKNLLVPVARRNTRWSSRIDGIIEAGERLAASLYGRPVTGIHRDFYQDQLLIHDGKMYILDLDLYCAGDPAVDIGNFIAHLQELSMRMTGNAGAMDDICARLVTHYQRLSGDDIFGPADVYRKLTLARHIAISQRIPSRHSITESLIGLCEDEFAGTQGRLNTTQQNRGISLCQ